MRYCRIGDVRPTIDETRDPVAATHIGGQRRTAGEGVGMAAGNAFSLALTGNGQVFAWGANDSGPLGNGTVVNSSVPARW